MNIPGIRIPAVLKLAGPLEPAEPRRLGQVVGGAVILALVALVAVGYWKTGGGPQRGRLTLVHHVDGLMGTTACLSAVVTTGRESQAAPVLDQVEQTLRNVEARLSTWLEDSELGRLNAASAGRDMPLSPVAIGVLHRARRATDDTGGAFDATCRPLVELWREAGRRGKLPTEEELAAARAASNWDLIELTDRGATKQRDSACLDLGGIAKGYAIDRAIEVLRQGPLDGGVVDVGGDLACFGHPASTEQWSVDIRNPFGLGVLARLRIAGRAVCTSGDYARFVEIDGKQYSHIIDPRSGRPAAVSRSVTVVASTAVVADVWATALSVLGTEGFAILPAGTEALIVEGDEDSPRLRCTPGLRELLEEPLPAGLEIVDPADGV